LLQGETGIAEMPQRVRLQQVAADGAHVAHLGEADASSACAITGQFARTSGWAATSLMRAMASRRSPEASLSMPGHAERLEIDKLCRRLDIVLQATASDRCHRDEFRVRFAACGERRVDRGRPVSVEMPAWSALRAASRIARDDVG